MDSLKTAVQPETKLHFLDYWRIIRIRKTVIIAVFLLVAITATIVTFILPESFSSVARIKVERDVNDVAGTTIPQFQVGYDPYFIQTEFEVIQSSVVLDRVIDALDLTRVWAVKYNVEGRLKTSECRLQLKRMIELRPQRNTSLIEIRVYSDNKDEAAKLANEIAQVYHDYRFDQRVSLIKGGIKAFQVQLDEQDKLVKDAESKLSTLRDEYKVMDSDPQSSVAPPTMEPVTVMHYNSIRIENEALYVREDTMLNQLKQLSPSQLRQTLPTAVPDNILSQLLSDEVNAHARMIALKNDYGDAHPEVQRTLKLMDEVNMRIDERVRGIMNALEVRVASLRAVVKSSEDKVNQAKANDIQVTKQSQPYYAQKAEVERLKKFREVLAVRMAQETVEMNLPKSTMVEIIDKAEPGLRPVRPNKYFNIAAGIFIGLFVGVGLAFFIEYLDTSVKTIDDVERALQAPVLGVIPQNVGYLIEEGAESPHAEAYRVLRTNLLFSRKDDKLNSVAVVSAGAGEGKSTTVVNLATTFAQSGQRVIVVDSDLRRPTLHKVLNVANTKGLTNYLLKQNTLEEVVQQTPLETLHFLSSGKLPSSSLGILSSAQMKDLINELKARYDFVFFDSPPIMGVSDASILASEVDMTVQVIQYRRYPQPMNIRAKQLIEKVGGNLIGIVLNNINMSQDESYYYYSGYYHDYYSKNEEDAATPQSNGTHESKPRVDLKPKF